MDYLNLMKIQFENDANFLGDYQAMSKTELANGYCDAEENMWKAQADNNEDLALEYNCTRDHFFSALMLRYWFKIYKWKVDSASLNQTDEDFVDWLRKSLWWAMYYKTWRYEFKANVKEGKFIDWKLDENGNQIPNPYYYKTDDTAVDKIINRCCFSMRGEKYQYFNNAARKASTQTYSLDAMLAEKGDSTYGCNCKIRDENLQYNRYYDGADELIEMFIKKNKIIQAVILDVVNSCDCDKEVTVKTEAIVDDEVKTITKKSSVFAPKKAVSHLRKLGEKFMNEFCDYYDVDEQEGLNILQKIKKMESRDLYDYIDMTFTEVRENPAMLSCLQS